MLALYHMSIQQYIVTRRIAHAEQFLRDTALPVSRIAEMVGYKHIGSLSGQAGQQAGHHAKNNGQETDFQGYPQSGQ